MNDKSIRRKNLRILDRCLKERKKERKKEKRTVLVTVK